MSPLPENADMPLRMPAPTWLVEQLHRDGEVDVFARWGRSTVIDEHLGEAVLEHETVRELAMLAGQGDAFPEGNAGLLHVYGYLFSSVETPFGHKRDRWLDGALATALGFDASAFLPNSGSGTALQRVTDAALPLFDDRVLARHQATTRRLDRLTPGLVAHTVLSRAPGAAATALAYALESAGSIRLITLFPLPGDPSAFLAALDAEAPRLRYNAVDPTI